MLPEIASHSTTQQEALLVFLSLKDDWWEGHNYNCVHFALENKIWAKQLALYSHFSVYFPGIQSWINSKDNVLKDMDF